MRTARGADTLLPRFGEGPRYRVPITCDHGELKTIRLLPVGENGEKYLCFPYLKCCFEAFTQSFFIDLILRGRARRKGTVILVSFDGLH